MTPSLADRCREVLELERKATVGPWNAHNAHVDEEGNHRLYSRTGLHRVFLAGELHSYNVAFIVAARNLIRELAQHYLDSLEEKKS